MTVRPTAATDVAADQDAAEPSSTPPSSTPPSTAPRSPQRRRRLNMLFVVAGLFVCFVLAGFVSGFASSNPDGLEKVAGDKGFLESADDHAFAEFPIADYAVEGIDNERVAGGVAGVIGVTITFLVGGALVFGVVKLRGGAQPAAGKAAGPSPSPSTE